MTLTRLHKRFCSAVEIGLLTLGIFSLTTVSTSALENSCEQLASEPDDDYIETISELTERRHKDDIAKFMDNFDSNKKTIILLHGGMGSELWQTWQSFDPKRNPADYRFKREEVWLHLGRLILLGHLKHLKIDGAKRDFRNQIIVADSVTRAPGINPYGGTLACFQETFGFNAYLLAWDTRRDLPGAVEQLRSIIERIKHEKKYDISKLFIVGHSMGGMVGKVFLETNPTLAGEVGGLISVGTPFYGYLGQLRRIFNGEPVLNNRQAYKPREVAEISSSAPAFYTLLPIDTDTYNATYKECSKETVPPWCDEWPKSYPVTDFSGNIADAYKDTHDFPDWVRERNEERKKALKLRDCLARPLPNSLRAKVFHIRIKGEETPVTAKWRRSLCPESQWNCDYDATQRLSPIKDEDIGTGEGDGSIPYWSAALVSTPVDNKIDLENGSHTFLMVENAVLQEVYKIIAGEPAREELMARCDVDLPPMATHEELEEELKRLDDMDPKALQSLGEGLGLNPPARLRLFQELAM